MTFLTQSSDLYLPIAHSIGFVAFFVMVVSFQSNNRTRLLLFQVIAMSLMGIHMYMLGALTGVAMMSILCVRNLVFALKERIAWVAHPGVLLLFLCSIFTIGIWSWTNWGSASAMAGSLIATYGIWLSDTRRIRMITLLSVCAWIPYTIIFKSYSFFFVQVFLTCSVLIAMWRYDRRATGPHA